MSPSAPPYAGKTVLDAAGILLKCTRRCKKQEKEGFRL
jgi:hypothetical protein